MDSMGSTQRGTVHAAAVTQRACGPLDRCPALAQSMPCSAGYQPSHAPQWPTSQGQQLLSRNHSCCCLGHRNRVGGPNAIHPPAVLLLT